MSVIPFVMSGTGQTIVTIRQEFEDAGGLDGNVILVQNIDVDQIKDTSGGNVTYDFRVGDEYRDHRDVDKNASIDGVDIRIPAGTAVIIETMEYVHFPKSRFGHIVPKVSLLHVGISNTSSKIDPGYYGKLSVTVFNLGKREVCLRRGQKFCTVYVLDVGVGVVPYQKVPKTIPVAPRRGVFRRFRDSVEGNQNFLIAITVILSIISLILSIVALVIQIFGRAG